MVKELTLDMYHDSRNQDSSILENYGITEQRSPQEIIYSADKQANSVFLLKKGCIRLVNEENGKTKIIKSGQFFGDRSIFYSKYMYAEALTAVQYIRIEDVNFRQLITNDAKLAFNIINSMSNTSIDLREDKKFSNQIKQFIKTRSNIPFLGNKMKRNDKCYCS
ncbi:Crp/Fnr family transcriptional regulator [Radiobacillus sp. PE A8.2]|uniref:Crp/Fnr family transcriptional regulator n=1 Tax=Radiobacillus sp. PE A8.2 TaxID=3380349 RepID=UPI00388D946A